ncbi:MAG: CpaF family protein [Candidatus Omnitrophica bacterium]|nr:CpaF family protein [Candidatus Omnitrophota bacterium]
MKTDDIKAGFNQYLINQTDFLDRKDKMSEDAMRAFLQKSFIDFSKVVKFEIPLEQQGDVIRSLITGLASLGPLRPLMEDPLITEIMVNGPDLIYIQRHGKIEKANIKFDHNQHLLHTIQKLLASTGANKRLDESSAYVDFSLPDGSRVNAIIPPLSQIGPVMTIRKFKEDITTVENLIELGELDRNIADLLILAMKAKLNVIFCGSTGSGKTTALNVFSSYIPEDERIITIEDTPELRLKQEHVVTLCTKDANIEGRGQITMRELFINCLRMRPDRIIVGELRGAEVLDMIESISSGHSGSLSIVHAESPEDCFNRLVTMMLMTGIRLSTDEIRKQVARAIDIVVHLELFSDGKRRMTAMTDVVFDEKTKEVNLYDIFRFKQTDHASDGKISGYWEMNKNQPSFFYKFAKRNVAVPNNLFV